MATTYPSALDALTNPLGSDDLDNPNHADQHTNANDAIEALQVKVGIDSSADTGSIDYKVANSTKNTDTTLAGNSYFLDEDNMVSDDATKVASQQSIKAYIDAEIAAINVEAFAVGAIYINITGVNPATELGYGTWAATAVGRMLVGYDSGDTDFDAAEETGGAKTVTLTTTQLPAHVHSVDPPNTTSSGQSATHTHSLANNVIKVASSTVGAQAGAADKITWGTSTTGNASVNHTHDVNIAAFNSASAGSGSAFSIMNPYYTVHVWKRTA